MERGFRRTRAHVFLAILLVPTPASVQAAEPNFFTYHPMSVMSLGMGYSPNDLSQAKLRAIEYTVNSAEDGALNTFFTTVLVRNSTQLKEALNLDVRVDASFLFFKGGATFTYEQSSLFTHDSVSVVLRAVSEYGRLTMRAPILSKEAKGLIDAGKMADFEQTFGSRYVVLERRGASVAVILTITDVSAGEKAKISAGLQASGGWGALGGSAKAIFQKLLERAAQSGNLNVQMVATGGEGFGGLADLVKALSSKSDGLKSIQEALGVYLKQFSAKNSVPIGFHTSSMRDFGWQPEKENFDVWSEENARRLIQIVDLYRATRRKMDSIQALIGNDDSRAILLGPDKVSELKAAILVYEKYLDQLAVLHKTLRQKGAEGKRSAIPPEPLPNLEIEPQLPPLARGSCRTEFGEFHSDVRKSFRYFADSLSNIHIQVRKNDLDSPSLKDLTRIYLIEGKFVERVELYFDKENLGTLKFKEKDNEIVIPLAELKLEERVHQMAATKPQGEGRFALIVQDRFARTVTLPLADARWTHSRTPLPFRDIRVKYIGSGVKQ